jgi:hypothetical protein
VHLNKTFFSDQAFQKFLSFACKVLFVTFHNTNISDEKERLEIAWSEAADDLKKQVSEWAENNMLRQRKWIQELAKQKIRSCKTLNKRARNEDSWNELCSAVSGGLREELRDYWFQKSYPDSKYS